MRQYSLRLIRSLVVPVVLVLLSTASASAQVVFDAASNASPVTVSTVNGVTISWNHTVSLAKKPYIVVSVAIKRNGGTQTVTTVTYGTEAGGPGNNGPGATAGTPMTLLGSSTNGTNVRSELWGLAGPAAGTHQITVAVANPGGQQAAIVAGARSFTNVFQTASSGTAVATTGNTTTPSATTANSAFNY